MRETEVERFVPATPAEVERALTPTSVVEYEGSFRVYDVREDDGATLVTAGSTGLEMTIRFEDGDGDLYYEQEGEAGPFDEMWTRIEIEPENEGSRVIVRSGVSLGLPVASLTDRIATWKRRGELKRALRNLEGDLT